MYDIKKLQQTFSDAENAFATRDFSRALKLIDGLEKLVRPEASVLHLKGLCQKNLGLLEQAADTLTHALKLASNNFQIRNNLANCLTDLGQVEQAAHHYDIVVQTNPDFVDGHVNKAILLGKSGRTSDAVDILLNIGARFPNHIKIWLTLGTTAFAAGNFDQAVSAYDQALSLNPKSERALLGRARAALNAGRHDHAHYYRQLLQLYPGNLDGIIGMAQSQYDQGDMAGVNKLREAIRGNPDWVAGHRAYADLMWEAGHAEEFDLLFRQAVTDHPHMEEIRTAYCQTLVASGQPEKALEIAMEAPYAVKNMPEYVMQCAIFAFQANNLKLTGQLLDQLPDLTPQVIIHKSRYLLRQGEPDRALSLLNNLVRQAPENIAAWAYLDLAWRLTGNEKHNWLHKQPGIYRIDQLDLTTEDIAAIQEYLRSQHKSVAHPLHQSLRNGTQTRGRLLASNSREISTLNKAISSALARYWAGLPQEDMSHPLLRHRSEKPVIHGSWSVRLTEKGYHIQHIHSEGLVSAACYFALPAETESSTSKAGWLEFGKAPEEIGLNIAPIEIVKPELGKISFFPSTLFHGTRPFTDGERISVAFDVQTRS